MVQILQDLCQHVGQPDVFCVNLILKGQKVVFQLHAYEVVCQFLDHRFIVYSPGPGIADKAQVKIESIPGIFLVIYAHWEPQNFDA